MLALLLILSIPAQSDKVDSSLCELSCSNHGDCYQIFERSDEDTQEFYVCDCLQDFVGSSCSQCAEGRFGTLCKQCPTHNGKICSGHGICDSGINSLGTCLCEEGFSASTNCSEEDQFLTRWPDVAGGVCILILAAILCIGLIVLMSKAPILPRSAGSIILGVLIGLCYTSLNKDAKFSSTLFFKPQVFFLVLIPLIMFEAGFSLKKNDFFNNLWAILIFAVFGTMLTALIFGVGLFVVCNVFALYKFTLIEALLFGSIISATDPVATISINKLLGLNKNLNAVIFGESVLNDAISIAMFKVFSSFVADKDIAWVEVVRDFGYLFFGSISIGLLAGVFISVLFKLFRFSPVLDTAIFFLWIYVPYLISEAVDMSGILAILFSGMVTGYYAKESLEETSKITTEEFFKTFSFIAENFCFVYFGISVYISTDSLNIPVILVSIGILLVTRALVVFLLSPLCKCFRSKGFSYPEQVVIWLSGARGAIAFSLALSLPVASSQIFVSTSEYIILFTIIVLGMVSYPIAKRFKLDQEQNEQESSVCDRLKVFFETKVKTCLVRSQKIDHNK